MIWAQEMTDEQIASELAQREAEWDRLWVVIEESGGHGGSPGEGLAERMDELETEQRRRAALISSQ